MAAIDLQLYSIEIPFCEAFTHAAASRDRTCSIWVEASLSGTAGYGEGCPRSYVTGESPDSARIFFENVCADVAQLRSVHELKQWTASHLSCIDRNPAAWCAIELALLDLFGKLEPQSVESLLGLHNLKEVFTYSAILGQGDMLHFERMVQGYLGLGMRDMKLKISGDVAADRERIAYLKANVPGLRLRLDANNLWQQTDSAIKSLSALPAGFFAVEEPIQPYDYAGMSRLARQLNVKIIVDESFLRLEEMKHLAAHPELWIINVRVSKMGGLIRSIEVIEAAKAVGISIIIGAQVGETSLLTRAALTTASQADDLLLAQEGAFGTRLLTEDISTPSLMFGMGGVLEAGTLAGKRDGGFAISKTGASNRMLRPCL